MRIAALFFALWIGMASGFAQASLAKLPRVSINGHDYIRISDWCSANKYEARVVGKEHVEVTGQNLRLRFSVNSQRAEINGVGVSLSLPAAPRNGSLHLAPLDFQMAIQPIIFPKKTAAHVRTICIDAGHGGKDPGNLDGKNQEKKLTLTLAEELSALLKDAGFKAILTRTTDRFIELPGRPEIANRNRADLFVSLHFNSAPVKNVSGIEVYCLTPAGASSSNSRGEGATSRNFPGNLQNEKNVLLAYQLQKSLMKNLGTEDRGVHRARFSVLRDAKMPAVLIEGGFMSNPVESKKLYSSSYRQEMARAILNGIQNYKKIVEQTEN